MSSLRVRGVRYIDTIEEEECCKYNGVGIHAMNTGDFFTFVCVVRTMILVYIKILFCLLN